MKITAVFVVLLIFAGCSNPKKPSLPDPRQAKFNTSDDSELYFLNLRQIYYTLEDQKDTKLKIYRFKQRNLNPDKPTLNLAIVHNWRFDEAYILLEANGFFKDIDNLQVYWQKGQQQGKYTFSKGDKKAHFRFTTELYRSILTQQQLFILHQNKKIPVLEQQNEREQFRKTMNDYYRLVGLL